MYFEILYHRQSQYTDLKTRNRGEVLHENYRYLLGGSASVLPVGHVEPAVPETGPSGGSGVVLKGVSGGGSGRSSDGVVGIKVDTNLEWCCPRAGCSMSSSHRPSEEDPADPVVAEGPGGPDGGLEGCDVQVVSQTDIVSGYSGECGHSCAGRPDGSCLDSGDTSSTEAVGGCSSSGGGDDLGGVADRAVAPGPPDTDVVELAGQVILARGHSAGARVPIEAGNRT